MVAATGRLVGREEELGALVRLLEAPGEAPDVAVLAGEAGIGKTTVWLAACEEASARGYRILSTRPGDVEAGWSFAGLRDLLGEPAGELLPCLPPVQRRALEAALLLGESTLEVEERTVAAATLSIIRALAEDRPTLLAVDDAQWLDPATLSVLQFALRRLDGEPAKAVLTVRGAAPHWLRRALPASRLRTVEIGALSLGATHELLRRHLDGVVARPMLIRIWETAGGNPFFALELAAALQRRGGSLAVGEELPIPTTLDELLSARLDGLSPAALEVAQVVAAVADPTVALVESVVERFDAGFAEARATRIVELAGERLRFTHPLLGPAVVARATPSRRRALHAKLAAVAPTSEQRARHLALATAEPDREVAATLEEAACSAQARGAATAAAELAEQAHALTPAADRANSQRRLLLAAQRSDAGGDIARARALLGTAREEATPGVERAAVLVELAEIVGGEFADEESKRLYEAALAEAAGDDRLQARIHANLAELHARNAGVGHARVHARLAVAAASRSNDVALACRVRAVHATCLIWAGEGLQRVDLEEAAALERALPDWPLESGPTEYLAVQLMWTMDLAPARALMLKLRDAHTAKNEPSGEAWHLHRLALLEWRAGNWERAERHATDAAAIYAQLGTSPPSYAGAVVAAHRGRTEEACTTARDRISAPSNPLAHALFAWILGFVDLSLGSPNSALKTLRSAYAQRNRFSLEPGMRLELGDFLEALVAVGELDEAEQVLAAWEPRAAALDRAWALAILARGRGLMLAARGNLDGAFASFERALAEHERTGDPFQHARTLLALGRTQRRAKRRGAARTTLTDALARFEHLGAPLWADQTRAELARIGGRTPTGDELTEAERRIADLVAEGRTNREVAAALFVSEHAVENALTRVYRKLGLRSRTELAARLSAVESR